MQSRGVKYEKPIEPIPRKLYSCPDCGTEYLMSVGQIIKCKHQVKK